MLPLCLQKNNFYNNKFHWRQHNKKTTKFVVHSPSSWQSSLAVDAIATRGTVNAITAGGTTRGVVGSLVPWGSL